MFCEGRASYIGDRGAVKVVLRGALQLMKHIKLNDIVSFFVMGKGSSFVDEMSCVLVSVF